MKGKLPIGSQKPPKPNYKRNRNYGRGGRRSQHLTAGYCNYFNQETTCPFEQTEKGCNRKHLCSVPGCNQPHPRTKHGVSA